MTSLRQLEYLVTIVEEGSFTQAAERLHITQPGLSHQFRALEKEAGGPLLERLPRSVRLTSAGRAMMPHARAALAEAGRAVAAARRATGVASGELQIATLYSISMGVLPAALRVWRARHPGVRVRLFEHRRTDSLAEAMRAGQADVAIGPPPVDWDGPVREVGVEEFVVVTAPGDPGMPAGSSCVPLRDLADREWVHFTPDSGLGDMLDDACAAAGFRPRVALRTEQGPSAAGYAAAGVGPSLVPANVIPPHFDGMVLRPEPPVRRPLVAYTRTQPDAATAAFIDVVTVDAPVVPPHIRRRLRLSTPAEDSAVQEG